MADRKVSELNAATAGNLHDDALLMAVDPTEVVDADKNVRATVSQVRAAMHASPTLAADDTTGTSLGMASADAAKPIPAGFWILYATSGIYLQMFINGQWRTSGLDPASPVFVISDGTNVRCYAPSGDYYVWLRRINPTA